MSNPNITGMDAIKNVFADDATKQKNAVTLRQFIEASTSKTGDKFLFWKFTVTLMDLLEKIERGEIRRLMVFMPPQHGKSTLCSQWFPAWFLTKNPDKNICVASYGIDLSEEHSVKCKERFTGFGNAVSVGQNEKREWKTHKGGMFKAVSTNSAITGRGFHVMIIDDPVKDAKDAQNLRFSQKTLDWYNSTFLTRLRGLNLGESEGCVIIVQTLWSEYDLAEQIMALEQELYDDPEMRDVTEPWTVLWMPALAVDEADRREFPPHFEVVPEWRQPGQALEPMQKDEKYLNKVYKRLAKDNQLWVWDALWQQAPKAKEGFLVRRDDFQVITSAQVPADVKKFVRAYDVAYTENGGDYTCSAIATIDTDRNWYIWFDTLMKQSPSQVMEYVRNKLDADGPIGDPHGTTVAIEDEKGSKLMLEELQKEFKTRVVGIKPGTANKIERSFVWRGLLGQHKLFFVADTKKQRQLLKFIIDLLCDVKGVDGDIDDPWDVLSILSAVFAEMYPQRKSNSVVAPYYVHRVGDERRFKKQRKRTRDTA